MKKLHVAVILGLTALYPAYGAFAQDRAMPDVSAMSAEEIVALREDLMKENGGLLRSAGRLSGEEAAAASDAIVHNVAILKTLFPEGVTAPGSKALDTIWSDNAGFMALFDRMAGHAEEMSVAATAGDADAYTTAFRAVGAVCGDCHMQYRSR